MPYSVLIVEDDEHLRQRWVTALSRDPRFELITAAGNLQEAQQLLLAGYPNLLLADLGLPDGDGVDLIRQVGQKHPATHIMVITVFGDEYHVLRAIRAGAAGYLLKDTGATQIGPAIDDLLAGGSPVSPAVARYLLKLLREPAQQAREPLPQFTERELETLQLIAKGYSYAEIGKAANISVNTVAFHTKQIYRKLSVGSRGEAVFEAQARGLITPPH